MLFGFQRVTVVLPKPNTSSPHLKALECQAVACGVVVSPVLPSWFLLDDAVTTNAATINDGTTTSSLRRLQRCVVVDALFGYSFTGAIREPFASLIHCINTKAPMVKVFAVDVPSGWIVDDENAAIQASSSSSSSSSVCKLGDPFRDPHAIISLMLPKPCVKHYRGIHYIGGNFVPKECAKKWNVVMPPYALGKGILRLPSPAQLGRSLL